MPFVAANCISCCSLYSKKAEPVQDKDRRGSASIEQHGALSKTQLTSGKL